MSKDMKRQGIKALADELKSQDPARVQALMDALNEKDKSERLSLRVTPAEKALIQAGAKRRRQTLSGYILSAVELLEGIEPKR